MGELINNARIQSILDRSEMYCSLKNESLAGVAFDNRNDRSAHMLYAVLLAIAVITPLL